MVRIDDLAQAAIAGDALMLRSLVQDLLRENPDLSLCPRPLTDDATVLPVAAGLVELLAERQRKTAPAWAAKIGAVQRPLFLLKAAERMKHLRRLCEEESPLPLRRRHLYAPPNFLECV